MKKNISNKTIPLALLALWLLTSSFGLLEPSTVLRHKAQIQQAQQDSVAVEQQKLTVEERAKKPTQPATNQEPKDNSGTNALANSLIQWIASSMKVLVAKLLSLVFHVNV